jgi:hypothetical protein
MDENGHQPRVIEMGTACSAPAIQSALTQLANACAYARDMDVDPWQFAIEIDDLGALGLTRSDLRWLVLMGLIKHAREVTARDNTTRHFQPSFNLALPKGTCFVLTKAGLSACSKGTARSIMCIRSNETAGPTVAALLPRWDQERRTLSVGGHVVKQFREPSPNQEAILQAFHEEEWTCRIDDPLPPNGDQDPKYRLHHTIQRLNNHQQYPFIRFRGDGTGQGVCWELTQAVSDASPSTISKRNLLAT